MCDERGKNGYIKDEDIVSEMFTYKAVYLYPGKYGIFSQYVSANV